MDSHSAGQIADAKAVVLELVNNAVVHCHGDIELQVSRRRGGCADLLAGPQPGWAHEFGRRVVALSVFVPIIGRAAPRRLAPRMLPPCATGVGIPGEPDSFGRLIDAQADGDLDTLRAHGLLVACAVLPSDDPAGAIEDLAARLR